MVSRRSLSLLAVAALLLPAGLARAQDANPRIATVNPAKVFNEMQETKDLKQKMESQRTGIQEEQKRRAADVEEARKQRNLFNEGSNEFQEKNKILVAKAVELQTWQQLIQAELLRDQKAQMMSLFKKIEDATKEIAQAKKYDLVIVDQRAEIPADLEQINIDQLRMLINQRTVLFNDNKFDITQDVINAVDAKYRSGKK